MLGLLQVNRIFFGANYHDADGASLSFSSWTLVFQGEALKCLWSIVNFNLHNEQKYYNKNGLFVQRDKFK